MNFTNLKQFMDHMVAERMPGNAIEVYFRGQKVFHYASGYSDLETATPLVGDEMFNLYSCSKLATVTAGLQLLERGRILLNDPLYEYIPEFKEMHIKTKDGQLIKAERPILLRDLFSMTAGFSYNFHTEGFKKAREVTGGKMDTVETIRCVAQDPLGFEPGTHWRYSICHDVLAAVVSVVSGQKFRDYVKENIFDPLGMTETVYHHTEETLKRTASQYSFIQNGKQNVDNVEAQKRGREGDGYFLKRNKAENTHVLGPEYDSGGAGIVSTVSDYAKLIAALAGYGKGDTGERILSTYSIDLMRTNRLGESQLKDFNWPELAGCGYGLGVRTHMNSAVSGVIGSQSEFGWDGAAGAVAFMDPVIQLGVFYVAHTFNPRAEYYQPRLRNIVYSCL